MKHRACLYTNKPYKLIFVFVTKVCEEHLEQHLSDVQQALDDQRNTLSEMTVAQQYQLSAQSEAMNTWSCDQSKLVEKVSTRVNRFLVEELKEDFPTGLYQN